MGNPSDWSCDGVSHFIVLGSIPSLVIDLNIKEDKEGCTSSCTR